MDKKLFSSVHAKKIRKLPKQFANFVSSVTLVAERVGFEPTCACAQTDFERDSSKFFEG
jgi:hypothetical protein